MPMVATVGCQKLELSERCLNLGWIGSLSIILSALAEFAIVLGFLSNMEANFSFHTDKKLVPFLG